MPPIKKVILYAWAAPTTAVGLTAGVLTLVTRGKSQIRQGVLEFHGGFAAFYLRRAGFAAITLGHVILARDSDLLDRCRNHEQIHVRQVERWGPFFLPAYLMASAWIWARGGRPYLDNPFEREAYDNS
jgi:cytochrome c-type biogenesis protein CcmH/NrfF